MSFDAISSLIFCHPFPDDISSLIISDLLSDVISGQEIRDLAPDAFWSPIIRVFYWYQLKPDHANETYNLVIRDCSFWWNNVQVGFKNLPKKEKEICSL